MCRVPTGIPHKLPGSSLEEHSDKVRDQLKEQRLREPSTFRDHELQSLFMDDPDVMDTQGTQEKEGMVELWKLLPHLDNVPESILRKLPYSAVFSLSNALAKNSKLKDKMGVNARLAFNASEALKHPTQVKAGQDNRKSILHMGRFLGGASCSNTELWQQGRSTLPPTGVPAFGNYDMDTIGCGGCVTPRGWKELHDPSSQELKIRLFYMPNVANSGLSAKKVHLEEGEDALSIGQSMKEIADLDGFKGALNTLREAMHSALPWNRSVSAIVGYMTNTDYLREDLQGNSRRAQILAEFTDYILGRNALNWENSQPFVTTDEMAHIWANWRGKRIALFTKEKDRPSDKRQGKSRNFEKTRDICKRYNAGVCPKQSEKSCTTAFGSKLRHVCNRFMGSNGVCEKEHPRKDHK